MGNQTFISEGKKKWGTPTGRTFYVKRRKSREGNDACIFWVTARFSAWGVSGRKKRVKKLPGSAGAFA